MESPVRSCIPSVLLMQAMICDDLPLAARILSRCCLTRVPHHQINMCVSMLYSVTVAAVCVV